MPFYFHDKSFIIEVARDTRKKNVAVPNNKGGRKKMLALAVAAVGFSVVGLYYLSSITDK